MALGCKVGFEFIPQNRLSIIPPTNPLPYNPACDFLSDALACALVNAGTIFSSVAVDLIDGRPHQDIIDTHLRALERSWYTDAAMESLKRVVGRQRPPGALVAAPSNSSEWLIQSFPSGHAGKAASVAASMLARCVRDAGNGKLKWNRVAIAAGSEAAAVTVAMLRVLAGLHHVEDVIASFLLAHVVVFSAGIQEPFCQVERGA
jgi:membrane-associated phospholipid phosphatase